MRRLPDLRGGPRDALRAVPLDAPRSRGVLRVRPDPAGLVGELLPLDGLDPWSRPARSRSRARSGRRTRLGLSPRDALLVVGAGTSGLLHIGAAVARGTEAVFVLEPRTDRRERALAWGAREYDGGPVDAAVATAHHPEAITAAAAALGPGGRLCIYAPPEPGGPIAVDGAELFLRELTVTASWSATAAEMRTALALLRAGAVRAGELLTHRFALEHTGAALGAQRDGSALKAVVLPWGEVPR